GRQAAEYGVLHDPRGRMARGESGAQSETRSLSACSETPALFLVGLGLFLFRQLRAQQVAERAEALPRLGLLALVLLVIDAVRGAVGGRARQPVPPALVDLDHLRLELRSRRPGLLVVAAPRRAQFGVGDQALAPVPVYEPSDRVPLGN